MASHLYLSARLKRLYGSVCVRLNRSLRSGLLMSAKRYPKFPDPLYGKAVSIVMNRFKKRIGYALMP